MPFVHWPRHWHSSVYFKSDVKHLHRPVHPFLHPSLISSLHTFKACDKSVDNGIISFSTFANPIGKYPDHQSLYKQTFITLKIEDWRTYLKTCCLSVPLIGGMLSIFLLSMKKRNRFASHTCFVLQIFEYNLTQKNSSTSNSSSLISSGVAVEGNFLNMK